ncbi:hotdog fold thioesterase [Acidihalobacter prosperus]|uniref:Thioesterase domain-containing protein n=1 Tax=Acidihalobacter prosperus TaxID=160660 RepID=A0A1A6C7Z6_9GAMM|nr:hotdog fold thioesterase [Acidihalobacter prosperus]OBS10669.1 hypothetical protein Thpro_020385 [Acidihalobacter prosperus]
MTRHDATRINAPRPPPRRIWKQPSDLHTIAILAQGTLGEHLGIRFTEIGPDFLRASMPVDVRTRQPFGRLHGGASCALTEEIASMASWLCLSDPDQEAAVGIQISANHLRGKESGEVTATARPLHLGRSTHVWDVQIEDENQRPLCVARLTLAIIRQASVADTLSDIRPPP